MKQGKTVLHDSRPGLSPRVEVGTDDRAVWVSFGTYAIFLSNVGDITTVTARCEGYDSHGHPVPVEVHPFTDLRGAVEFRLTEVFE